MRKRAAIAAATVTALAGAAVGLLPAGADYRVRDDVSRCNIAETKTQHTIVANSFARVWERHRTVKGEPRIDYYACSNRVGRHFKIASRLGPSNGPRYEEIDLSENSINASFAAHVKRVCPAGLGEPCSYELRQIRLKNGQLVRRIKAPSPVVLTRPLVFGPGQLAYGKVYFTDGGCACEVHTVHGETDRIVDSGSQVDLTTLTLASDGLSGVVVWRKGNNFRATAPGSDTVYD
jgi:hypothetical protein